MSEGRGTPPEPPVNGLCPLYPRRTACGDEPQQWGFAMAMF